MPHIREISFSFESVAIVRLSKGGISKGNNNSSNIVFSLARGYKLVFWSLSSNSETKRWGSYEETPKNWQDIGKINSILENCLPWWFQHYVWPHSSFQKWIDEGHYWIDWACQYEGEKVELRGCWNMAEYIGEWEVGLFHKFWWALSDIEIFH